MTFVAVGALRVNITTYVNTICCYIKGSVIICKPSRLVKLRNGLAISLMYTTNKRGPRTDPCGTSTKIDFKPEKHNLKKKLSVFSSVRPSYFIFIGYKKKLDDLFV